VTTANAVPQLNAAANLAVAGRRVPGGRSQGLGLLRTTVSWKGFRYLQLLAEIRLSLPPKLPVRAPMPASLEPIWLREDLPVKLLTTRSENFLVDSGVPR
jgi:hypothetical protein